MGLRPKIGIYLFFMLILASLGLIAMENRGDSVLNSVQLTSKNANENQAHLGVAKIYYSADSNSNISNTNTELFQEFKVKTPFLLQAPFGVWDALHEDACEEASLLTYRYFFDQRFNVSTKEYDKEITSLIDYESSNGYGGSVSLEELAQIAQNYYPELKKPRIETNVTLETLKTELNKNHPIIIPADGKLLYNPNFKNGGPNYHMLVLIGYDQQNFITNDPGTKKGQDYTYPYNVILNSIHDWNPIDILQGKKSYLVFD